MITKEDSSGKYALLYNHKVVNGGMFPKSSISDSSADIGTGTMLSNVSNCYSRMHRINDWSDFYITGKYTFIYEDVSNNFSNKWSQTINPLDSTDSTTQVPYSAISLGNSTLFTSGLKLSNASSSCKWCCNKDSTWYFPIYQYTIYNGGIPTANIVSSHVRLWIKIPS